MRKGFTPTQLRPIRLSACLLLVALSLIFAPAEAQILGKGTYRDGFPTFLRYDPTLTQQVVLTDTVVSLLPVATSFTDPDTFILSGVDWRYPGTAPALLSPESIIKIPEELETAGQDFYLITDALARKVYLLNINTPAGPENSYGGLGVLDKPVDAFPYRDSAGKFKVLITDQGNNSVIQVDWLFKTVDWRLNSLTLNDTRKLSLPSNAISLGKEVLIADTGNNRVVVVDTSTKTVVWEFEKATNDNLALNAPVDVKVETSTGLFLITDKNNHRVLLVERATREKKWQFGTGQRGNSATALDSPTAAQVLPNGNVLICDTGNKRLIEVNRQMAMVYTFAHPLTDLRDAYRILEGPDLDKTLVIANNQPISQNVLPFRLAYFNETFDSAVQDFSRPVNYDSLSFPTLLKDLPVGTRIRVQLRSADVLADVFTARWYGPQDTADFYTGPITAINPIHDGHRFLQFRVYLNTNSPLLTPVLRNVMIKGHYFDTNATGVITSQAIRDSLQLIITSWQKLIVNSVLPADPLQRNKIQIDVRLLDEQGKNILQGFTLSTTTANNQFDLSQIEALRRQQGLRLQATLKTNNSAVTPKLNDWQLEWQNTKSTASRLRFTDPTNQPVTYYRVPSVIEDPPLNIGTVFLSLEDLNLLPIENAVRLDIRAVRSGDVQSVLLTSQPTGQYLLTPGYPAVVTNAIPSRIGVLEARDRDTLTVRYSDPTDPSDVSTARALIIQTVKGKIQIEDPRGARMDTVAIGDTLFVHITGETDRDFSPAQDSVTAKLFGIQTNDLETVTLYEMPNPTAPLVFDTGEFRSRIGIPLVTSSSLDNDGKLLVTGGDQVRADYIDIDDSKSQDTVRVRPRPIVPDVLQLAGNKAFDFYVAPNPFHAKRHNSFRLAAVARTVDIQVQRLEIYNLAGERVRSIPDQDLPLTTQIPRGQQALSKEDGFWWDFRTQDGSTAAAGTYWAKFYVRVTDPDGRSYETTALRKFVIVR
ncbi:MAG: hypothetical protein ONB44_17165 [candidate division KSB1 bacterium]|nr:hypothetical protein [candidate division KSB1 bacterium]MDZ7303866.1 hypothetical protein [candidate division KSB1 bacterium]MDZ7313210.1 hypothetical protein [candidate division KSB1 bacterium]